MLIATELGVSVEAGLLLLGITIMLGPLVAERLRIPGLVGLIAMGTIFGPYVLGWIRASAFVAAVGATGLLYLMFVAGVELDLKQFLSRKTQAVTFGLLTFGIPFAIAFAVGWWHLGLGASAASLVGAMWASHTLVAYPEAKAAGLDRNPAVGLAVAATVITDVIALVVLAVASSSSSTTATGEIGVEAVESTDSTVLPLWAAIILLVGFCFVVLPAATRWTFAHLFHERTERFVWALTAMAAGGVIGLLGGIEGLVGAFLAGLGINVHVPVRGELMERIEFFGGALFVPAFLVSVGLSIDPTAVADWPTLRLAAVFTVVVVVGKAAAAAIAAVVFGLPRIEAALMAVLTMGQAAATLAVAQVGISTGLFDREIFNAAVVTVVTTVLITSFGTRFVAPRISSSDVDGSRIGDHIIALAPSGDPDPAGIARLARALARDDGGLVTPCAVAIPGHRREDDEQRLRDFEHELVQLGQDTEAVLRVADTVPSGMTQLADEVGATMLLLPISHGELSRSRRLGDELARIGRSARVPCVAAAIAEPEWERVVVMSGAGGATASVDDDALAAEIARRTALALHLRLEEMAPPRAEATTVWGPGATAAAPEPGDDEDRDELGAGDLLVVPAYVIDGPAFVPSQRERARLADVTIVVVTDVGRAATLGPAGRTLAGIVTVAH